MKKTIDYYVMRESGRHYPIFIERETDEMIYLQYSPNAPRKPIFGDYITDEQLDFVKIGIVDALKKLNIEGIKFVPTELLMKKNEKITDFFLLIQAIMYMTFLIGKTLKF